jgi:cell division protein ZipA
MFTAIGGLPVVAIGSYKLANSVLLAPMAGITDLTFRHLAWRLGAGLVYGEMNIFHRFEDVLKLGKNQFSMANMMEPGTFDLETMDQLHTPGVVFFLGLPTAQDSMQAFDFMLETAQCLASNLGGEVLDEQRSVMRPQTIEHCRQQIRDFERRSMTRRAQL